MPHVEATVTQATDKTIDKTGNKTGTSPYHWPPPPRSCAPNHSNEATPHTEMAGFRSSRTLFPSMSSTTPSLNEASSPYVFVSILHDAERAVTHAAKSKAAPVMSHTRLWSRSALMPPAMT